MGEEKEEKQQKELILRDDDVPGVHHVADESSAWATLSA